VEIDGFRGRVITADHADYDIARAVWNASPHLMGSSRCRRGQAVRCSDSEVELDVDCCLLVRERRMALTPFIG
jgi:hypothetical protein